MKMADVITGPEQLSILERLNIHLGFGEATIEEICKKYNLSTNLFIIICSIYSSDSYTPNIEGLTKYDISRIIGYLQKSHRYWIEQCFPPLHEKIHIMLDLCDEINKNVLNKFYDDYDEEIKKHLDFEEHKVFPYIHSIVNGNVKPGFRIHDFEKNHSDIDEKLNDLKSIVIKYLSQDKKLPERIEVLNEIFKIESDLHKHTMIENKLLIPLVSKYEKEKL